MNPSIHLPGSNTDHTVDISSFAYASEQPSTNWCLIPGTAASSCKTAPHDHVRSIRCHRAYVRVPYVVRVQACAAPSLCLRPSASTWTRLLCTPSPSSATSWTAAASTRSAPTQQHSVYLDTHICQGASCNMATCWDSPVKAKRQPFAGPFEELASLLTAICAQLVEVESTLLEAHTVQRVACNNSVPSVAFAAEMRVDPVQMNRDT